MSRLQQLPPDQSAALSLLLRAQRTHSEVAQMLGIAAGAVHDRAHAGLAILAPRLARQLDAEERERIGEYLLGQLAERQADAVIAELAASDPAREWAAALAAELGELPGAQLPEIPAAHPPQEVGARAAGTPGGTERAAHPPGDFSRRGGALVLAAIIAAVIAVVVVLVSNGGGSGNGGTLASSQSAQRTGEGSTGGTTSPGHTSAKGASSHAEAGSTAKSKEGSATGATGGKAAQGEPKVEGHTILTASEPNSHIKGALVLASEGGLRVMLLSVTHLPPTEGFTYVLWLISGRPEVKPLAFEAPAVKATGKEKETMLAGRPLPEDASAYDRVELTRETVKHPTRPSSEVVLSGEFKAR